MNEKLSSARKALAIMEALGVGLFYVGMLAFFLYPVVDAAGYLA